MPHKKVLEYIPMVKFLAHILGEHCEIVLHDLQNKDSSILAIENGYLSGRSVGGAATDFILQTVHTESYKNRDFESRYIAKTYNKTFLSSSYFIKDDKGEIVGTLCVNIDSMPFQNAVELLNQFLPKQSSGRNEPVEQLLGDTKEIVQAMVEQVAGRLRVPRERMSVQEKMAVVKELSERGAFQLRGATGEISNALGVSEPTVYRYLNKVR